MTNPRNSINVVAVTGGRGYSNWAALFEKLDSIHGANKIDLIVTGGCRGADWIAGEWATKGLVQLATFAVTARQWQNSLNSGPVRNKLMLTACRPDVLVACPGGKGTAGCVALAKKLGIIVEYITEQNEAFCA